MKTGMLAAEAAFAALQAGRGGDELVEYQSAYEASWVYKELKLVRNAKPLWSRFGALIGIPLGGLDMWTNQLFGFSLFGTLKHGKTRRGLHRAGEGLQADRLSQAGWRDQLRQVELGVHRQHQPRRRPARSPDG
jgi:flavin-dependent dehydrogenase